MNSHNFSDILQDRISKAESVNILPHVSADGDALGSSVALALYLRNMNKKVRVIAEEKFPDIYEFICSYDFFEVYDKNKEYKSDINIALDTGDLPRLGNRSSIFTEAITFNIDHHKTNKFFADYNYVVYEASSTGEMIFDILLQFNAHIDKEIAKSLYVAISTDTGGFRYQNTTVKSFETASMLVKTGIDISEISTIIFETVTLEKTRLICTSINNLSIYANGQIALINLGKSVYEELNVTDDMFDGIVNIARNIKNVKIGVLIRETPDNEIKVNLRSNDDMFDVSKVAAENNGGGHVRAAGFTEKNKNLKQTQQYLISRLEELLANGN